MHIFISRYDTHSLLIVLKCLRTQVLRDIVKEVQSGMVPRTMLTDWATTAFPDASHYWTFRKMVTVQLGVLGLMEYVLHLTRLYPEMLHLHQDSGLINVAYYKFNMDDTKGRHRHNCVFREK